MSDDDRKVLGLFSRKPIVENREVQPAVDSEHPFIDQAAIAMLEDALERFKKGELLGAVLLSGIPDKHGGIAFVTTDYCETVWDYDQTFIGACHQTAYDIIRIVEAQITDLGDDDD